MKNPFTTTFIAIVFLVIISNTSDGMGMTSKFPDFHSMVGTGSVNIFDHDLPKADQHKTVNASVTTVNHIAITGMKNCSGITLKTDQESIVTVGSCDAGKVFICPAGQENCNNENFTPTKLDDSVVHMRVDDYNYRIEVKENQLIYRIQEKSCLIPYPHGCLVNGPGWNDLVVYTFKKQ